jgi:hypothetical protein
MREKIEHGVQVTLNRKRIAMEQRIVKSMKILKKIFIRNLKYIFF